LPAKHFVSRVVQPNVVEKSIEMSVDKVVENLKKLNITDEKEISEII